MASDRAERIENALLELIDSHILPYEGEDEEELENRRDDAVVSAKEILDRSVFTQWGLYGKRSYVN